MRLKSQPRKEGVRKSKEHPQALTEERVIKRGRGLQNVSGTESWAKISASPEVTKKGEGESYWAEKCLLKDPRRKRNKRSKSRNLRTEKKSRCPITQEEGGCGDSLREERRTGEGGKTKKQHGFLS